MNLVKVLLVTDENSKEFSSLEQGFKQSALYALRICKNNIKLGLDKLKIEIDYFDISRNPNFDTDIIEYINFNKDLAVIVGAAQSKYTKKMISNPGLKDIAIFSPLSTSTFLLRTAEEEQTDNFFQTTSYDKKRVEVLLSQVIHNHKGEKIYYYHEDKDIFSYSGGLATDTYSYLKRRDSDNFEGIKIPEDIEDLNKFPTRNSPVVICTGSSKALEISKRLRKKKYYNPIYTFGSNSNLEDKSLLGAVVICDLDREEKMAVVQEHLDGLRDYTKDPSISTVRTFKIIMESLKNLEDKILKSNDISRVRKMIISHVNNQKFLVDNMSIDFEKNGESTIDDNFLRRIHWFFKFKFIPYDEKSLWNNVLVKEILRPWVPLKVGITGSTFLGGVYATIKFWEPIVSFFIKIFD